MQTRQFKYKIHFADVNFKRLYTGEFKAKATVAQLRASVVSTLKDFCKVGWSHRLCGCLLRGGIGIALSHSPLPCSFGLLSLKHASLCEAHAVIDRFHAHRAAAPG